MGNLAPNYAVCFIFAIFHIWEEITGKQDWSKQATLFVSVPSSFAWWRLGLLHNRRSPGRGAVAGGGTRVTPDLFIFLGLELKSHSLSFFLCTGWSLWYPNFASGTPVPFRALIFHLKVFNSKDPSGARLWASLGYTNFKACPGPQQPISLCNRSFLDSAQVPSVGSDGLVSLSRCCGKTEAVKLSDYVQRIWG